jgi:pimeloyl-ACP methyl ester carboxylesterase
MDPTFFREDPQTSGSRNSRLRRLTRIMRRLTVGRIFRHRPGQPPRRWMAAIFYRLAFVPIVVVLLCWAMVFRVTHPSAVSAAANDPLGQGLYFESVSIPLAGATPMSAWLVPVLDAQRVLEQKDKILRKRFPAVVLVHDFGKTRSELLALVRPLHDAGIIVLLPALRGSEESDLQAQTFGLREANDVEAAVEMLRTRQGVDAMKIALVGTGSGANASRLAATRDKFIAATVLDRPVESFDVAFSRELQDTTLERFVPILAPGLRWTFEIMYGVDANDLRESRAAMSKDARPMMRVDSMSTKAVDEIVEFLAEHLNAQ